MIEKKNLIEEIESKCSNGTEKSKMMMEMVLDSLYSRVNFKYTDGAGDGGIDYIGSMYDSEDFTEKMFLVQGKYGTAHKDVRTVYEEFGNLENHILDESFSGREDIFNNIRDFIKNNKNNGAIFLVYVTTDELNEKDRNLSGSAIEKSWSETLGIEIHVRFESLDSLTSHINALNTKIEVDLECLVSDFGSEDTLTGYVKVNCLMKMMEDYGIKAGTIMEILRDNLRYACNNKRIINGLLETIDDRPKDLGKIHNGITIISRGLKNNGNNVGLINPSIINGGTSSYFVFSKFLTSRTPYSDDARFPVKIIDVSKMSEEEIERISIGSNTQAAISKDTFLGLTPEGKEIIRLGKPQEILIVNKKNQKKNFPDGYSKIIEIKDLFFTVLSTFYKKPKVYADTGAITDMAKPSSYRTDVYTLLLNENYDKVITLMYLLHEKVVLRFEKKDKTYGIEHSSYLAACVFYELLNKYYLDVTKQESLNTESDYNAFFNYGVDFIENQPTKFTSLLDICYSIVKAYAKDNPEDGVCKDFGRLDNEEAAIKKVDLALAPTLKYIINFSYNMGKTNIK